ncbi:5-dehydro-2-deoxygluconokinase [Clostridium sp. chh4-2]|uniref:5-dehydro-2-deoxygluconokinase n=1 Tax=Clostridium sp. chh4-2 TaxID=2067550 RepID=UPI000CCE78A2|nr:5-dehydro-2-deoxygluconokinase [Clostridium sp. chh4-2]PNV58945.1 5-dehydro-2-deoxygluconokinase [Clostridium sp. chh4-2]
MSDLIKDIITFDETRTYDMILLGRVAIDFNPIDYFKTLGESHSFKKYIGGSPANTAVGLARLGKKCGFFSRVSDDQFGDFAIDYFNNEGIDTSHIFRCEHGEKIGLTFTEILSPTESSILMYRNQAADLSLDPVDIEESYIASAKMLLISGTALAQSPSREASLKAAALAKKTNTPIVFDIDYRPYNWKSEDEIAIYYSAVAKDADIIMGSREEYDLTERFLRLDGTDQTSADYWTHKQNAKIVVIKHGKEGSTAYTRDGKHYSIKPFPVKALKSFGGGDGYAASFLYGVLEGMDMMDALEMGSAEAAMLVASHGCSADMPNVEQVKEFIKKEKEEYGEMVGRA